MSGLFIACDYRDCISVGDRVIVQQDPQKLDLFRARLEPPHSSWRALPAHPPRPDSNGIFGEDLLAHAGSNRSVRIG